MLKLAIDDYLVEFKFKCRCQQSHTTFCSLLFNITFKLNSMQSTMDLNFMFLLKGKIGFILRKLD